MDENGDAVDNNAKPRCRKNAGAVYTVADISAPGANNTMKRFSAPTSALFRGRVPLTNGRFGGIVQLTGSTLVVGCSELKVYTFHCSFVVALT